MSLLTALTLRKPTMQKHGLKAGGDQRDITAQLFALKFDMINSIYTLIINDIKIRLLKDLNY
jgi:hypothetical protein